MLNVYTYNIRSFFSLRLVAHKCHTNSRLHKQYCFFKTINFEYRINIIGQHALPILYLDHWFIETTLYLT